MGGGGAVLLAALVGAVFFRFQTLESAGTRTTAREQDPGAWTQNEVRFLPCYRAKGFYKRDGQEIPYSMSVDKGESGRPIFRCTSDGGDGNREGFLEKVVRVFLERVLRHPQQCVVSLLPWARR